MTVLIDSWVWIEYFQGSKKGEVVKKYFEGEEHIIISTINISEVFRHVMSRLTRKDAESAIDYMLKTSFVIPVNVDIAIKSAIIKHEKKWGLGDSIILATAQQHNATVVTGDPDFRSEKNVVFLD